MEAIAGNVFYEVAFLLMVATLAGVVAIRLKQPLIVAFIAVGVFFGSGSIAWSSGVESASLLSKLGISLLLFLVGLKLDFSEIKNLGKVALATGVGQIVFTSVIGFALALLLSYGTVEALYIAVALTFSSTIIIVKLLSDKKEIDSLHGRISVGFLIVQDIAVIIAMIALSAMGAAGGEEGIFFQVAWVGVKAAFLLGGVVVVTRYLLTPLMHVVARSRETLVLFGIAWAVVLAALGDYLGFSKEVGAFVAGVSVATTPYKETIGSRLVSLRDFLLLFFFVDLGAMINLNDVSSQIFPAALLSLFVLVGNPLIVMLIMKHLGYRKRTGFLSGLAVAQISEFSLILGALGVQLGHVSGEAMGLITLVGLITIGLSTYMILYSNPLYERLSPWLSFFEKKKLQKSAEEALSFRSENFKPEVVIFGLGRYGELLARDLMAKNYAVLGVDFDPQAVEKWHAVGFQAQYGDAEDPEFFSMLATDTTRLVICTLPGLSTNVTFLRSLRSHGYEKLVALTAHHERDESTLLKEQADVVLMPFKDAAEAAGWRLRKRLEDVAV